MVTSAFDLSGSRGSSIPQQNTNVDLGGGFTGGQRWVNGVLTTANPGFGWDANGNYVNIAQAQAGQQAQAQAQKDLESLGGLTPYQISQQAASAADPFASQRPQYQNAMANLMQGNFDINDPSYKFRFDQGQQALERSMAAKGFLGSGNMLTELQKYGQGMASQEYQNQYNRLLPLTGATTGSPAAAGLSIAGLYDWRNNALANMGGAMAAQGSVPMGGGVNFGSSSGGGAAGAMGTGAGRAGGGGGGGSTYGGGGSGSGSFGVAPSYTPQTGPSMGYDPAYSDEMLRRQMAAGGGSGGGGGGYINAVPGDYQGASDPRSLSGGGTSQQPKTALYNKRGDDGIYYIYWSDGSKTRG